MTMHRSTKTGLIAIAILICVAAIILLLNLENIRPTDDNDCVNFDGKPTCHATDSNPFRYFGTKTAYQVARGNDTYPEGEFKECTPQVFYLLSRHATRYPDKEYIVDMINKLPELRDKILQSSLNGSTKMCAADIDNLSGWNETMQPKFGNKISPSGEAATEAMARRLKKRFPSILDQNYSPEIFTFGYTSRKRTKNTAEAFAKGLFPSGPTIDFQESTNDDVLQFNKGCKKIQEKCGNDTVYDISEVENFGSGPLMQKVVDSISDRVGLNLSFDDLKLAYLSCAFGYALETRDDWCALFSDEELRVLEYEADIDDYYKDAYGNKINAEQACPVANFVVDLFKSYEASNDSKVILHFSHAGAIKKVYTMFGLFQDDAHLTADSFCHQDERKWRSSLIVPFNSNIILVLYECGPGSKKLAAFHNEKLVRIQGCDSDLCPLEHFYSAYSETADQCDIDRICRVCRI